ncbi:hypothetical protein [Paraburkholderia sp. HD33-4]|uniref:hypothetical protein n=1 Tax=Paraburkholderia sp. HD33-4 TaxID=2883242 RepID=UPI001F31BE8A|nr:hypothetical protein [Paraburkholderia sp. HD33-4]
MATGIHVSSPEMGDPPLMSFDPPRQKRAFHAFFVAPTPSSGNSDSLIEAFVRGEMSMIDAHQPATVSKTPTDAALLDHARKPSPDIRVFGIGGYRGALTNLV